VYDRSFSANNLRYMLRLCRGVWIVSTLLRQLSWSNFLESTYLKDTLKRDFYSQIYAQESWSNFYWSRL